MPQALEAMNQPTPPAPAGAPNVAEQTPPPTNAVPENASPFTQQPAEQSASATPPQPSPQPTEQQLPPMPGEPTANAPMPEQAPAASGQPLPPMPGEPMAQTENALTPPAPPAPNGMPEQQPPGQQMPPMPLQSAPQQQAYQAQQQYLQDMAAQQASQQPGLPPGANPAEQQGPQSKAPQSGPQGGKNLPYDQINQVLMSGEPGYRWGALEEISKAGMAPPETFNILCQTVMPKSPLMTPEIPAETQSRLRQASFWTLALLDSSQNANIPAIAALKNPQTGQQLKDPKTGQLLNQMLPGLQEASRVLHDKKEDPGVQAAAVQMIQKIIQTHPNDRPALENILKGLKTRDPNVQALAHQGSDPAQTPLPSDNGNQVPAQPPAGPQQPQGGDANQQVANSWLPFRGKAKANQRTAS